jgi:hypothetical protein
MVLLHFRAPYLGIDSPILEKGESARQKHEAHRDKTLANSLTEVVQRALAVYEFAGLPSWRCWGTPARGSSC